MNNHLQEFNYQDAFSRNIGWVTEAEQQVLQSKRVAIAGVGGVGGVHLLTLTRLGIGNFNIADLDIFEQGNFNRQAGAFMHTVGRQKVEVMEEMAKGINPSLDIQSFANGVSFDNIDAFLDGVDLYIDGLDFFVLDIRRAVFAACAEKGIPAITAAPLGMGTAFLNFLPGKMTFEEYFRLEGRSAEEQQLLFMLGLSPLILQKKYLADHSRVRFGNKKAPSTPMACELCAGVAATNALKILLRRGDVVAAPHGLHFDAYLNVLKKTWRPWGNNNPIQKLMFLVAKRFIDKAGASEIEEAPPLLTPLERVLDKARWAPSGDNTQPWKFEILDDASFRIHASDTRDWCFYDLNGQASQIAVGALLETISIAASGEKLAAKFTRQASAPEDKPVIDVELVPSDQGPSPLLPYIPVRCTNRRPFQSTPLTSIQKRELEQCLGSDYKVIWIEGEHRKQMAKLLFDSAEIRLTTEEGYRVHSQIIEWDKQFSETKIPDQAVGFDAFTLKLMRWSMQSWQRVQFLNKYLAGTLAPRIQLDLLPGRKCSAHFILLAKNELTDIDDFLAGGRLLQRFWLTATKLGLQFQPEMTPLIFSRYVADGEPFTENENARATAKQVAENLSGFLEGANVRRAAYMGRLGHGPMPQARSIRLPLAALCTRPPA
ncbi:thiamine biosynthesis protein ThiF [Pseudomaricurvus alcaniphilus]|uniref:ThiF family adenylyltransferase n=1 Tax=Pseudomaricurvus alcaniphilus TaxID=1166482 RepID=UPI001408ED06|nr:ThiF family adenylyltransferase [Pseudomaricurvus alcaniphilus]NHN36756.1 thiamine biosynthesis protein ThiF [Pseudomaricurvus alcaniphilus]